MRPTHQELLALADEAAANAHAPYSHFHVGAALLTADGRVFKGCNVENSSYGLTVCAERTAVGSAIASGATEFATIAIVQGNSEVGGSAPCWPCGACRQVLVEFNPDLEVVFRDGTGVHVTSARELLPHSFDVSRLKVR